MRSRIIGTKDDYAALVLRLILGIVFFVHGSQMALGWFGGYGFTNTIERVHPENAYTFCIRIVGNCR